jgi:putative membrane protein
MTALMAFLHHVAAFALVAAIAVEFVLVRQPIDQVNAHRLALADMVVGSSAGVLLVVGLLRVFYFEKGAAFYLHNAAFIAKMALFVAVALLSIYPTLKFLSWRKGRIDAAAVPAIRRILHLELVGVVLILLCAALMARGIGFFG